LFRRLIEDIRGELSGHKAFECDRHIFETDRWSNFTDYHATAEWIADRLEDYGLAEVELVECPADGKTRYSDWTMPIAWDSTEATLRVVGPPAMAGELLARRSDVPSSLVMWSAPTPPEGVTGEVVLLERGTADEVAALGELDGRILLTALDPRGIKKAAADAGALGIVADYTRNPDLVDEHGWINAWSDTPGGWMMTASDSEMWSFSITRRSGRRLRARIRAGETVKLHATVDSRLYEGTLPYVTALVPGETDEEVLTLGHLYEHGANDNAAGTATIMEVCRTLNALRERGELSLKRGVRLLLMAECYGSLAFATHRPDVMKRTVASLCLDGGAGHHGLVGSLMRLYTGPNCMRSYVDAAAELAAREYFARYDPERPWLLEEYSQGTDNFFCDPVVGVPSVWSRGGHGGDYWHNTADSLDKLDPDSFRDWGCISAAFLGIIASAGEAEALALLSEAAPMSMARLERVTRPERRALSAAPGEAGAEAALGTLAAKLRHLAASDAEGFRRYDRLAPGSSAISIAAAAAEEAVAAEAERMLDSAAAVVGMGGMAGTAGEPEIPSLGDGGKLVPKRNPEYITCLTLDGVPQGEWKAVGLDHSPRWWGAETCALWWADGERDLDEIARRVKIDVGRSGTDLVGYFRMLERHGYVELAEGSGRD